MAATLSLSRTKVSYPGDNGTPWADATVVVDRRGVLTVTDRQSRVQLVQVEGVSAVQQVSRSEWRVTTPEGEYMVTKAKGCGCQ